MVTRKPIDANVISRIRIDGERIHGALEDVVIRLDIIVPPNRCAQLATGVHVCNADGLELDSRIDDADPQTGQVRGWVLVPVLQCGEHAELTLVSGPIRKQLLEQDLVQLHGGAFHVEGWIHIDEARLEGVQVVAASWDFASRPTEFSTYDAGGTDGQPTQGFFGAIFDGRYVYFAPQCNNEGRHGHALRYDTHQAFGEAEAWQAYDAGITEGLRTTGFYGAVFDGRFVYYIPRFDGESHHSRVLRLDTAGEFADAESWSAFDAGRPISCQGAAFDGRYVYFAPGMHQQDGPSGCVLRFDSRAPFHHSSSWIWYDVAATDGLDCRCFDGALFDGRHVYFVPLNGGPVVRYDPNLAFDESRAWEAFDTSALDRFAACVGAVFDGRRIYFVPYAHDAVVCYDTESDFRDEKSWTIFTPGMVDGLACRGYDGAVFDGRWVSFIPFWDGESTSDGFHARLLRCDTTGDFTSPESWQAADGSQLAPPNPGGFNGGAFDGRFIYMAPWRQNDPAGEICAHGQVLRLDTAAAGSSFQLRWVDCGHNGGLGGSVPGPSFLVNCVEGPVSAQAHIPITRGWHHVAGVYCPEEGAQLWVDGECVARQPARGEAVLPSHALTVGQLAGGSGALRGEVAQLHLRPGWLAVAQARTVAENLRDPHGFACVID